jgi:hypothetical protein
MTRILIGVLSAQNNRDKRSTCRETWSRKFGAIFLLGNPTFHNPDLIDDILVLTCRDDYENLPWKTIEFCRWALGRDDWDMLGKCDDDTFVSPSRLAAYDFTGKDYVGCQADPGDGWSHLPQYASGGAGYFMSRRLVESVAACERLPEHPRGAEDVVVGQIAKQTGIQLFNDPRFLPYADANLRPKASNDCITGHFRHAPLDLFYVCQQECEP